jgi:hypothetical protein
MRGMVAYEPPSYIALSATTSQAIKEIMAYHSLVLPIEEIHRVPRIEFGGLESVHLLEES